MRPGLGFSRLRSPKGQGRKGRSALLLMGLVALVILWPPPLFPAGETKSDSGEKSKTEKAGAKTAEEGKAKTGQGKEEGDEGETKCPAPAGVPYEQALALAKKQGKPVAVFFSQKHCRKCELLMEKGFSNPGLACYIRKKIVFVNAEAEKEKELAARFGVSYFPTVWFLTPEGDKIDYFTGYVDPEKLGRILHYIGDREYETKTWQEYEKEQAEKKKREDAVDRGEKQ